MWYFKHIYDHYKDHMQSLEYELAILGDRMSELRAWLQDIAFFEDADIVSY